MKSLISHAGQGQIAIVKHVPYSILKKRIKHHKGLPEVMPRLLFIRLRYTGVSVANAADVVGVSGQMGYNWQARWNAEEFEGLVPQYAGGHPSKLTDEQKADLLEKLRENDHWRTVEAQRLIQSHLSVAYSLDQVRRILKSFGMYYGKPWERSKQEDVREVLRAYRRANPGKRLVIILDNFGSHHTIMVRQYAAGNNIFLVHLPPYPLDRSPIE